MDGKEVVGGKSSIICVLRMERFGGKIHLISFLFLYSYFPSHPSQSSPSFKHGLCIYLLFKI